MVEGGSVLPLHSTARRICLAVLAAALALAVAAGCAYPTAARPACADAVLEDWTQGVLGPDYPADCYEAAVEALPEDLRAYTSAADDIERAAASATRTAPTRQLASSPAEASVRTFPTALALLLVVVTFVAVAGLVAAVLRRRRLG